MNLKVLMIMGSLKGLMCTLVYTQSPAKTVIITHCVNVNTKSHLNAIIKGHPSLHLTSKGGG